SRPVARGAAGPPVRGRLPEQGAPAEGGAGLLEAWEVPTGSVDWMEGVVSPWPDGRVEAHPSLPSTNDRARELAAEGAPEGTVVVADRQTAGRGRRGRTWSSPPGRGIWCSLIVRPSLGPGE